MSFNGLESGLDVMLCEQLSDRSDSIGLLVLHKMAFSSKVELFKRFSDDFQRAFKSISAYTHLVSNLREAARLRNIVVHADWESTEDDGYTYVALRVTNGNMEQEHVQLSGDSLMEALEKTAPLLSAADPRC